MLINLSKMAYENLQNNFTLTFDESTIEQYCFNDLNDYKLESFDGMGLLQVTNHENLECISKTYEFIHRTLQELLAAWYISLQDVQFQQQQLQKIFNKKEFEMIWIFYSGLTKFSKVAFKDVLQILLNRKSKCLDINFYIYSCGQL